MLTLNAQRELCVLDKAGGAPLKPEELLTVLRAAVSKVRELSERITRELEKDAKTRVLEVS